MTLKEKLSLINCTDCDMPYCEIKCTILKPSELNHLEKVADDFSMDFANWLGENEFTMFSNGFWYSGFGRACTTKELLEIYKEELWNTKKK